MTDILIIDDEKDIREMVSDILEDNGYATKTAYDSISTFASIAERVPDLIILDIWLQGSQLDGLGILEKIKKEQPHVPVIMISGHGNIETAISSIKIGAYDYIEKPFKEDRLLLIVKRAIETANLKKQNDELKMRGTLESELIGTSSAIKQLKSLIGKVANTSSRILITGEPGSGKEVVAREIHLKSDRAERPFIVLNVSNTSPSIFESELFGKEDNTGNIVKTGVLERAHKGTLFVDEIADIPAEIQVKLLKFIQTGSFERVNGKKKVTVNVRIISATSKNVDQIIKQSGFKEDLYYRLNVVTINVPSLRERKEDIIALTEYFIKRCSSILGMPAVQLDDGAYAVLQSYKWPGNSRQLRNIIERLIIMSKGNSKISSGDLPAEITIGDTVDNAVSEINSLIGLPLKEAREEFEKQYISMQIKRFNGNISRTAEFIGMERSAFHRKLKNLNVTYHEKEKEIA